VKLLQNRLKQAEFVRTVWAAQPEPGTTLDEMLQPEYWAHVAKSLKQGSRIEVTAADGEWFAELFVRSATANDVKVFLLRHQVFSEAKAPEGDLEAKHRGGAGWSVVRKSDKRVLVEKLETRGEAEDWIANNLG
jgi:hypothetical protein